MDREAWWATVHGGHRGSDMIEHTHTQLINNVVIAGLQIPNSRLTGLLPCPGISFFSFN